MPAVSEAQRRAMYAAASGNSTLGIPKSVGKEFTAKDGAPVAAGIIFVAPDGDVLLLRRSADEKNYGGHWGLPGGKGEAGEGPLDCALREAREELGVYVEDEGLHVIDEVETPNGMVFTTFVKPAEDKFMPRLDLDPNHEHSGFCWASLDMLPQPLHPSVARTLGENIGAAQDMSPEDWSSLRENFAKWTREEEVEPEHAADTAFDGAMDRSLYDAKGKRIMSSERMALDRKPSVRTYDADGHLHIKRTPISKANVCEYWGHEIPNSEALGLDPQRKYALLRDPEELAKGAATSNGKQLLLGHVPVSADDPQKDKQVGGTGTDAEFEFPYLYNSLHLHDREGIDAIEAADEDPEKGAKELSSAYRYTPVMTPGVFQGTPYDGVMTNIIFNHVALVPEGRAGADVVVGDSQLIGQGKEISMSKVLTRFGGASAFALSMQLLPKLASDAKIDLTPFFEGVTKKNFSERKAKIAQDVKAAVSGKLAKDAKIDDVLTFALDAAEKSDIPEGADEDPNSGLPMNAAEMKKKAEDEAEAEEKKKGEDRKARDDKADAFLKGKLSAEDKKAFDDMMGEAEDGAEENAEGKEGEGAAKSAKDGKEDKGMDKKAMDAALKDYGDKIKRDMRETAQAYADVEPYVGKLALGMDSATEVLRTALKGLGMDAKAVNAMHPDALKPVLLAQPKPGEKNRGNLMAQDSASSEGADNFQSRWGDTVDRLGAA